MDIKGIQHKLMELVEDWIKEATPEDAIKNAYRIKHLISAIKDLQEMERLTTQTYEQTKRLVVLELMNRYPELGKILERELGNV